MRALITFMMALFAITLNAVAYSDDEPYRVAVVSDAGLTEPTVEISFETVADYSSMCGRTTSSLELTLPAADDPRLGLIPATTGRIEFVTTLKPGTICLMAFGPHRGGITLPLGDRLPGLADGYYALTIDGHDYGYIEVRDGAAQLVTDAQAPE